MINNSLTALQGIKVGHSTHSDKLTGCTVVLFDDFYPVAYKSFGGAPGTYSTESLKTGMTYTLIQALFIAGGSLNGLTAASKISRALVKKRIGSKEKSIIMPVISGAIVYDLGLQIDQFDSKYGQEAVDNLSYKPVKNGNVGAGTGTSVGKFSYTDDGLSLAMKAGVGSARINLGNGVIITALSVVNAMGNVILPDGSVLAGNRNIVEIPKYRSFERSSNFLSGKSNTTISIVGINVDLGPYENYEKVAQLASQGHVRAINPVNTSLDGDTVFVFSTKKVKEFLTPLGEKLTKPSWTNLRVDIIGHTAAKTVQESIYNACRESQTIKFKYAYKGIVPSYKDY